MTDFDPRNHIKTVSNGPFLAAGPRMVWFRLEHPGASILTELVEHDRGDVEAGRKPYALVKATVTLEDGTVATGWALEDDFGAYVEKAETSAVSRCLDHLGYGTDHALAYEFRLSPEERDSFLLDTWMANVTSIPRKSDDPATPLQVDTLKRISQRMVRSELTDWDSIGGLLLNSYNCREFGGLTKGGAEELGVKLLEEIRRAA